MLVFGHQNGSAISSKVDTLRIFSELLREYRTILVFTPLSFNDNEPVDILYMLDGEFSAYWFSELPEEKNNGKVVGIGILTTDRRRDLLPFYKAENFIRYIDDELIPLIGNRCRVRRQILFGHSFGGATVLYTLLHHETLFDCYIAASAKPIMDMIEPEFYSNVDENVSGLTGFFIGYGDNDHRTVKKWHRKLISCLNTLDFKKLRWRSQVFQGASHSDSSTITLLSGMDFYRQLSYAAAR